MWYHIPTPIRSTASWSEQKRKLKDRFSILTERDLDYEESAKDEMLSNMQVKLSKTKVQLKAIISAG